MSTTHNGWANVETWRVQLHLANNEAMARRAGFIAGTFGPDAVDEAAATLRDWFTTGAHACTTGVDNDGVAMFVADTLDAALERVDWSAIARAWMERVEATA